MGAHVMSGLRSVSETASASLRDGGRCHCNAVGAYERNKKEFGLVLATAMSAVDLAAQQVRGVATAASDGVASVGSALSATGEWAVSAVGTVGVTLLTGGLAAGMIDDIG